MIKEEFINLMSAQGVLCAYSGHTNTMYISGQSKASLTDILDKVAQDGSIKLDFTVKISE